VYKVEWEGRFVAIKTFRCEDASKYGFTQEFAMLKQLNSPNVVGTISTQRLKLKVAWPGAFYGGQHF